MITAKINSFCRVFYRTMCSVSSEPLAPVGVRGMTTLDRDKFSRNVIVPVLKIPEQNLSHVIQCCKKYLLKLENFKPVQDLHEENSVKQKCIHLHSEKIKKWSDITEQDQLLLQKNGVDESNFGMKEIQLNYNNWRVEQVFKAVLPEGEDIVSGFSQIGHIIHLNLRDHVLNYRTLIGQVLLDKIKTCRTVVNKSNIIDNTYRNFSMEVIAGDDDFNVKVKENRCTFEFDFSKVYWNPRLGREHERILELLKSDDILFDVFCGVGPFAIPAAKRKCRVYANDLNPDSFKWLNHNAKINKIEPKFFKSYNEDGAKFIQNQFKQYLKDYLSGKEEISVKSKIHVTMNLPAMAVEFLKYFTALLDKEEALNINIDILVHVYCFAVGDDLEEVAKTMVIENLKYDIRGNILEIVDVRDVSPKKRMFRISFKLPKQVLCGESDICGDNVDGPPHKRLCIEKSS